jgi:hypothetical protein
VELARLFLHIVTLCCSWLMNSWHWF